MAPAVREKVSKRPANRVEKPAIWQDVMVEVKETFRRIGQVKHSGFTLWDDRRMRTGPTLSRNRMARVKTQAPLRSFNLPPRTLREIENNRSQPPIVSFNHLQNLLGMCRRINAQSSLTERRKNPHDPSLYPVFIRRPVGTSARPLTPNSATPARRPNSPASSAVPNRPSSAGNDRRRRPSTPSSVGVSRPLTPPYSARKRPHTARPAMDDPPYAYAPPRFTLLLDISNRPATLGPPPPFTTRPSSASNTPRPGSSRSQKDDTSLKHPDEQQQQPASPNKKPRPPVPALKKIPADRALPKLASDRTFDRTSQQSGSVWSFGPMAAAYFERRPLSAGDRRPQSAGDVHSERPPSRRRAAAAPANRPKPVLESSGRSAVSTDLSVPDSSASSSVLPDRLSPSSSSSSSSGRSSASSSTTGPDMAGSEEATSKIGKGHNTDLWSPRGRPASPSDQRPPSRRGAKPTRKKKKVISASESTITTTTTEPSTLEASDENASGKTSGVSTARGPREDVKRPDPSRVRAPPPYKSRSVALDNTRFDAEIKTPRGRPSLASSSISGGEAKGSPRRASNLSVPATRNLKPQEQTQTGPSSEEPSPGRPKVTFAAASASEERKQWKESIDVKHSKQDQAMDRSNTPKQSKQGDQRAEAREDALQDRREGFFQRNLSLTSDKSRPGHDGLQPHHTESILKSPRSSLKKEPQQDLVAVDIASEEEEDAETREDSTGEDSIKTTTCIQSCSEISSEMSATEHEEDDDDDEHRRPANEERQDARELEEVHQLQLPQQHDEKGEGEHHHHHQQQQHDGEEGDVRENASDVLIKFSADAYVDFKNSMMNVIWNDHLESGPEDQLEKLFQSYIDINPPRYHAVLREVIADISAKLKQAQRP